MQSITHRLESAMNFSISPPSKTAHRWILGSLVGLSLAIGLLAFLFHPRMSLTQGIMSNELNPDGTPSIELQRAISSLKSMGVSLNFKTEVDMASAKPHLTMLLEDPQVDWVLAPNTGAELPSEVTDPFVSLGIIRYVPIGFFVHQGEQRIHRLSDLKGKRIVIWATPEGNAKPVFSPGGAKASPYSNDMIFEKIFTLAGVTPENTPIINTWPDPLLTTKDWDVIIHRIPDDLDSPNGMMQEFEGIPSLLLEGKIELASFVDTDAVSGKLPMLRALSYPASGINVAHGIPKTDIPVIAYTVSAIARKDIADGVLLALAHDLKSRYGNSGTLLGDRGEFPNFSSQEAFKPSQIAADFYSKGMPLGRQFIPPAMYEILVKTIYLMIPLITLVWPIMQLGPNIYGAYSQLRLQRYYWEMVRIERRFPKAGPAERKASLQRLFDIDRELLTLQLPKLHGAFVSDLYEARSYVDLVITRLSDRPAEKA
jgi:hypothetical protein